MENSFLKTGNTHTTDIIDLETGEVVETTVNKTQFLANTKEDFYLMYASMILVLKSSSDVKIKLFASLIENYGKGQTFALSKGIKEIMAQTCDCSPRSFDTAFTALVRANVVVKIGSGAYKINPRHVFMGSSSTRDGALKAVLTLHCPDC